MSDAYNVKSTQFSRLSDCPYIGLDRDVSQLHGCLSPFVLDVALDFSQGIVVDLRRFTVIT